MTQRPNEIAAPNDNERGSGENAALQIAHRELDAAVDGLHRARLFGRRKEEGRMSEYPRQSPQDGLAAAEKAIVP